MDETQQINKMAKSFGMTLLNKGSEIVKYAFKLKPAMYPRANILNFLSQKTGISATNISLADEKYYVVDWNTWGQIIDLDIIDTLTYKSDYFDCDNFSGLFASRANWLYNLNSVCMAFGNIYNKDTGEFIGRHAFNLIIAQDNGILNLYCYEPMNDGQCLVTLKNDIVIGEWRYEPDWILCF